MSRWLKRGLDPNQAKIADNKVREVVENIIEQIELLISTTEPIPENRTPRCEELLRAARALTDDLLRHGRNVAQ